MTLIATLCIDNYPVLVGDLLLSGPERANVMAIPTVGDVREVFPTGSGWSIVGLKQKINIITDNCIVAWAGSECAARTVVTELRDMSAKQSLSLDSIASYFRNLDAGIRDQGVSFVGWIKDPNGIESFGYDCEGFEHPWLGSVRLAGTGTQALYRLLMNFPRVVTQESRATNALEQAITQSLMTTGLMLQEELASRQSLLTFYGGGYEVASLVRGSFQKVGNITYVFWIAKHNHGRLELSLPFCAQKYDYVNDLLLIRAAHFNANVESTKAATVKESLHVVAPLYRRPTVEELNTLRPPSFQSRFTCHCVIVTKETQPPEIYLRIEYSFSATPSSIRIEEAREGLSLAIHDGFVRALAEEIQHRFGTGAPST